MMTDTRHMGKRELNNDVTCAEQAFARHGTLVAGGDMMP